jgi:hypothetical protein
MKRLMLILFVVLVCCPVAYGQEDPNDPGWWESVFSNGMQLAWRAITDVFWNVLEDIIDVFMSVIPEGWYPRLQDVWWYIQIANTWLPIDVGFTMLGLYMGFLMMFSVVKWVLKLIPFIG